MAPAASILALFSLLAARARAAADASSRVTIVHYTFPCAAASCSARDAVRLDKPDLARMPMAQQAAFHAAEMLCRCGLLCSLAESYYSTKVFVGTPEYTRGALAVALHTYFFDTALYLPLVCVLVLVMVVAHEHAPRRPTRGSLDYSGDETLVDSDDEYGGLVLRYAYFSECYGQLGANVDAWLHFHFGVVASSSPFGSPGTAPGSSPPARMQPIPETRALQHAFGPATPPSPTAQPLDGLRAFVYERRGDAHALGAVLVHHDAHSRGLRLLPRAQLTHDLECAGLPRSLLRIETVAVHGHCVLEQCFNWRHLPAVKQVKESLKSALECLKDIEACVPRYDTTRTWSLLRAVSAEKSISIAVWKRHCCAVLAELLCVVQACVHTRYKGVGKVDTLSDAA